MNDYEDYWAKVERDGIDPYMLFIALSVVVHYRRATSARNSAHQATRIYTAAMLAEVVISTWEGVKELMTAHEFDILITNARIDNQYSGLDGIIEMVQECKNMRELRNRESKADSSDD